MTYFIVWYLFRKDASAELIKADSPREAVLGYIEFRGGLYECRGASFAVSDARTVWRFVDIMMLDGSCRLYETNYNDEIYDDQEHIEEYREFRRRRPHLIVPELVTRPSG